METRADIERLLRQGLLTLDEIARLIAWSGDEVMDNEAALALVRSCWQRVAPGLVRPSRSLWARVTSRGPREATTLERLEAAFDAMDRNGIMARLFPTADRQPALIEIHDELAIALSHSRDYEGYCVCDTRSFFGQELPRAPLTETTFFYGTRVEPRTFFDGMNGAKKVAEKIVGCLAQAGFEVAWNGSPGTAIAIVDVEWQGWRHESGAPLVHTGRRLPDEPVAQTPSPPNAVTCVFFSAGLGQPDAHRLLSWIARHSNVEMYGDLEKFDVSPASVAIRIDPTRRILDLVGGPAPDHPALSILQRKAHVARCSWLVATATTYPWDEFGVGRRIFVATEDASPSPTPDAWRIISVNLRTGEGVDQLLRVLEEASERG